MILAGIDQAGYGPTLGPLVVSVSAFRVPDGPEPDLWSILEGAVCRKPDGHRIAVDDSKRLFAQKKGIRGLEEGILPFLGAAGAAVPRDLRSLVRLVSPRESDGEGPDAYLDAYPWYRGRNLDLPAESFENFIVSRVATLRQALAAASVECLAVRAWPVEVLEFNREVSATNNKALVSFRAVGSFLGWLWRTFPGETVEVMVDRQGGRIRYAPLLYEQVRPRGIRIEAQTEGLSVYRLVRRPAAAGAGGGARPGEFRVSFAVDCEGRSFAVALASMLSKYLREVHMLLFNRYWREQMEDLRPTAGYALDARRFLREIQSLRGSLGINDGLLVRLR